MDNTELVDHCLKLLDRLLDYHRDILLELDVMDLLSHVATAQPDMLGPIMRVMRKCHPATPSLLQLLECSSPAVQECAMGVLLLEEDDF